MEKTNKILEAQNNHYIRVLEDQEMNLNQQYINDINALKDEKAKEIEKIKDELMAEKIQAIHYKQKFESIDSIHQSNRKKDIQTKDELIKKNDELTREINLYKDKLDKVSKESETEKNNILLSRDQVYDSEKSSLLRRALVAEEKLEKLTSTNNSESANQIKGLEKAHKEYEMMLKLARDQLLSMNNEMVKTIESKERIQKATQLVLEENRELKEQLLKLKK